METEILKKRIKALEELAKRLIKHRGELQHKEKTQKLEIKNLIENNSNFETVIETLKKQHMNILDVKEKKIIKLEKIMEEKDDIIFNLKKQLITLRKKSSGGHFSESFKIISFEKERFLRSYLNEGKKMNFYKSKLKSIYIRALKITKSFDDFMYNRNTKVLFEKTQKVHHLSNLIKRMLEKYENEKVFKKIRENLSELINEKINTLKNQSLNKTHVDIISKSINQTSTEKNLNFKNMAGKKMKILNRALRIIEKTKDNELSTRIISSMLITVAKNIGCRVKRNLFTKKSQNEFDFFEEQEDFITSHPKYIVSIYGHWKEIVNGNVYSIVITENGTTLNEYIKKREKNEEFSMVSRIKSIYKIAKGLRIMQECGYLYGDLSLHNFIVIEDDSLSIPQIKFFNFENIKKLNAYNKCIMNTKELHLNYNNNNNNNKLLLDPNILSIPINVIDPYTCEREIYSFGLLIYSMITSYYIFPYDYIWNVIKKYVCSSFTKDKIMEVLYYKMILKRDYEYGIGNENGKKKKKIFVFKKLEMINQKANEKQEIKKILEQIKLCLKYESFFYLLNFDFKSNKNLIPPIQLLKIMQISLSFHNKIFTNEGTYYIKPYIYLNEEEELKEHNKTRIDMVKLLKDLRKILKEREEKEKKIFTIFKKEVTEIIKKSQNTDVKKWILFDNSISIYASDYIRYIRSYGSNSSLNGVEFLSLNRDSYELNKLPNVHSKEALCDYLDMKKEITFKSHWDVLMLYKCKHLSKKIIDKAYITFVKEISMPNLLINKRLKMKYNHNPQDNVKIVLIITDFRETIYFRKFLSPLLHIMQKDSFGIFHTALCFDDRYYIEWTTSSYVNARREKSKVALFVVEIDTKDLNKILTRKEIYEILAHTIIEWNRQRLYHRDTMSCQTFVWDVLRRLNLKPKGRSNSVRRFMHSMKTSGSIKRIYIASPEMIDAFSLSKENHKREFKTHKELDKFCCQLKKKCLKIYSKEIYDDNIYNEDWELLKGFDRGFWLRFFAESSIKDYHPLNLTVRIYEEGEKIICNCPFGSRKTPIKLKLL